MHCCKQWSQVKVTKRRRWISNTKCCRLVVQNIYISVNLTLPLRKSVLSIEVSTGCLRNPVALFFFEVDGSILSCAEQMETASSCKSCWFLNVFNFIRPFSFQIFFSCSFPVCFRPEPSCEWAGGGWPQSSGYYDSETAAGTRPKTGNKWCYCFCSCKHQGQ